MNRLTLVSIPISVGLWWLIGSGVAHAQAQAASPLPTPDLSGYAKTSDLATVQSLIPTPMLAVPPMEALGGAAGTAGTYRTGNAVQPRITRMVLNQVTGSDGTVAVTWSPALPAIPGVLPIAHVVSGNPLAPLCYPVDGSTTTSGATIICYKQTISIGGLGIAVAPILSASAGIKIDVFAVPAS